MGGTFGYSENCVGTESRKKPSRQGYISVGRRKHRRSQHCYPRAFQQGRTSTKEASSPDCRRKKATIYADEKTLGGEKEDVVWPQTKCQGCLTGGPCRRVICFVGAISALMHSCTAAATLVFLPGAARAKIISPDLDIGVQRLRPVSTRTGFLVLPKIPIRCQ
jgi:hypothetical protein